MGLNTRRDGGGIFGSIYRLGENIRRPEFAERAAIIVV